MLDETRKSCWGQEVGGFFAMRYEECTARVHLDSQITLALFGLFFHCTALERRRYSLIPFSFLNYFAIKEL